jgi:L-fuconolactonase
MSREEPIIEPIIEPDLPIVDPHTHLWFIPPETLRLPPEQTGAVWLRVIEGLRRRSRYLFDELLADLTSGHNVRATVFVETHTMYRPDGPEAMKSLGEVEFANGVAAMSASGLFGAVRVCAGIVGAADLRLGDEVEPVLQAHRQAGGGRYRGVRNPAHYDADTSLFPSHAPAHLLLDPKFRAGFKWLRRFDLSFDVWIWEPQLPELIDLAQAFPDTRIVLNHMGGPLGIGHYAGRREQRFPLWRDNIRRLSRCQNVAVKLGGVGSTPIQGFDSFMADPPASSEQLSREWKPYIDTCIEAFEVDRCMFESDFPPGANTASYAVLWNAFKRLTKDASESQKAALFSGTATRFYRLDV